MGFYFGWEPETVIKRRQEYDLRRNEAFIKKVFKNGPAPKKYDTIVRENKTIVEKQTKEIKTLKEELKTLSRAFVRAGLLADKEGVFQKDSNTPSKI
jgi:hypothetical protein